MRFRLSVPDCEACTELKDNYDQKHLCLDSDTINTKVLRCIWSQSSPRAGSRSCLLVSAD